MSTQRTPQEPKTIHGFWLLLFYLIWAAIYIYAAPSIHQIFWLSRLPAKLEVLSYALHLIPFLGIPMALFWYLARRERTYSMKFIPNDPAQILDPGTQFSNIKLKTFVSPGIGIVLSAPEAWVETNEPDVFQVIDPVTGSEFTASAYENPGLFLEQWATLRNTVVEQEMPYLKLVRDSYGVTGKHSGGIAKEYEGVFPSSGLNRHYLVLCLRTDSSVISFSITASPEVFAKHKVFYRWLLSQLDIYRVIKQ
jgi:hypothetical protein